MVNVDSDSEYESEFESVYGSGDDDFDSVDSEEGGYTLGKRRGSTVETPVRNVQSRGYSIAYPVMSVSNTGKSGAPAVEKSKPPGDGTAGVYVLQYPNGMFYVGKSRNVQVRVQHHMKGPFARSWGKPTVVSTETTALMDDLESWERNETLHRMRKHGIIKVRGWKYTSLTLTSGEVTDATNQIREKYDLCRLCGGDGHFESECGLGK